MSIPDRLPFLRSRYTTEWVLLCSALLLVALIGGHFLSEMRQDIEVRERDRLAVNARVVHDALERQLDTINRTLIGIRDELPRWRTETDGLHLASRSLKAFAEAMPTVRTLLILDAQGNAIAANHDAVVGKNFRERDYFQTVLRNPDADTLYLGPPFKTVLGVFGMNLVRMVRDANGEFAGIVSATLDPVELRYMLESVRHAPDVWVTLVHADGKLFLSSPLNEEWLGADLAKPGSRFSRHRAAGQPTSLLTDTAVLTGERRLLAQHTLQSLALNMDKPIVIGVSRDLGVMYARWHSEVALLVGIYALLVAITAPSLYLIQRRRRQVDAQAALVQAALAQRTHEAEAASRAKSEFVANMSHEIRTPMNAVLGLLQLLELTGLDTRQHDYVEKAKGAARSLLGILNDILDFSKVESGKLVLDDAPFRLDEMLRSLSVVLSSALQCKEVEVLFQLDPAVPRALRGDGMRLQQVLLNLAGNAMKFTERGEVVVALQLLQAEPDSVRVEFSVRDTGIGITADRLDAIFDGFTQAETSTTRRFGGTGLGLAISRRLVHLMGGELQVQSTPQQGSRFYFTVEFRRDAQMHAIERTAAESASPQRMLRVLIVDDNATAREVLSAMVTSFGWQAETASSGAQAIALLEAAVKTGVPFDILCVDWIMPGMDGWETIQRLRLCRREAEPLPAILMITAHGREMLVQRLGEAEQPLDGFLVKPVTPSMLFDAVAQATQGISVTRQRSATPGEQTAGALAGLRILIVEDNPLNQQVARELLAYAGAEIEVAGDGLHGIECVRRALQPYDAILMDIQMPRMDGYAATRVLREEMGIATPIIAMTANALPADRAACLAAGMSDHIGKPIDASELIDLLRQHCRQGAGALAAPTASVVPALPALPPGYDLAGALARMAGNCSLLARLARGFGSESASILANAAAAWQQGEYAAAAREMHTLKGLAAATLGATVLAQQAAQAESACKTALVAAANSGECLPDATAGAATELAALDAARAAAVAVLATVADALDPPSAGVDVGTPVDRQRLREQLDELGTLLEQQNMRALDVFATLQREAGSALADSVHGIEAALFQLDFTAARDQVTHLQQRLMP